MLKPMMWGCVSGSAAVFLLSLPVMSPLEAMHFATCCLAAAVGVCLILAEVF